eukprot:TRINITY_DN47717_c0_g1_i1.p1 TRINITY_DN47717_c0_g1~~TRINITY_DN47717_c0_g1_i1.p1  ORF type:complete len:301 (+),score=73.84 TRINITY_DN47717_c0_g1_i1:35-937(+)
MASANGPNEPADAQLPRKTPGIVQLTRNSEPLRLLALSQLQSAAQPVLQVEAVDACLERPGGNFGMLGGRDTALFAPRTSLASSTVHEARELTAVASTDSHALRDDGECDEHRDEAHLLARKVQVAAEEFQQARRQLRRVLRLHQQLEEHYHRAVEASQASGEAMESACADAKSWLRLRLPSLLGASIPVEESTPSDLLEASPQPGSEHESCAPALPHAEASAIASEPEETCHQEMRSLRQKSRAQSAELEMLAMRCAMLEGRSRQQPVQQEAAQQVMWQAVPEELEVPQLQALDERLQQ